MNKKIAILAFASIAVIMGIAAISPAVYAQEPPRVDPGCTAILGTIASLEGLLRGIPNEEAREHIQDALESLSRAALLLCERK